ncbi:hypothetical protein Z043_121377, partial [Scleropages formosus]
MGTKPQITPEKVRVKEGDTVSLSCSAPAPCPILPPTLTWTPRLNDSVSVTELQEKEDKTKYVSSVLNFTASYLHHNKEMSCSAVYSLQVDSSEKTSQNSFILDVQCKACNEISYHLIGFGFSLPLDPPKNTFVSVSPAGSLLEGHSVTLNCSSKANPAVKNYSWYIVTESGNKTVGSGQELIFNVSRDGGQYYCGAQNEHGTENSAMVVLHVTYPPRISPPWSCNRTAAEISCCCESRGNPSPTIEWRLSDQVLANSTDRVVVEERLGTTGLRSSITMRQKQGDTHVLFCLSRNPLGSFGVHVYIPPSESDSAMLSGDMGITGAADEEDEDRATTLHYANIDFSSVQSNGKEQGVIRGGSQKTTDYAEIRRKPQNDIEVRECKAELQDEEGEYAEILGTRPGAEGEEKKGEPLSESGESSEGELQYPSSTQDQEEQTELEEEEEMEDHIPNKYPQEEEESSQDTN